MARKMINQEQEAIDYLSKEIQREIDFEIISNMLKENGWTEFKLGPYFSEDEIQNWTKINCQGRVHGLNNTWLFEKEKDATMFILRWS